MPKLVDYQCASCHGIFEYLRHPSDDFPSECPLCGYVPFPTHAQHPMLGFAEVIVSMPTAITIVKGNSDYSERERARLEKRSHDHWVREGRDEAIERSRAQMRKYHGQGD